MSEILFTKKDLEKMHNNNVEDCKNRMKAFREEKIKDIILKLTIQILYLNGKSHKICNSYFYNYDNKFSSDIVDRLREKFPDSNIVIHNSNIIGRITLNLFNYTFITVSWE